MADKKPDDEKVTFTVNDVDEVPESVSAEAASVWQENPSEAEGLSEELGSDADIKAHIHIRKGIPENLNDYGAVFFVHNGENYTEPSVSALAILGEPPLDDPRGYYGFVYNLSQTSPLLLVHIMDEGDLLARSFDHAFVSLRRKIDFLEASVVDSLVQTVFYPMENLGIVMDIVYAFDYSTIPGRSGWCLELSVPDELDDEEISNIAEAIQSVVNPHISVSRIIGDTIIDTTKPSDVRRAKIITAETHIQNDRPSLDDHLNFEPYVDALARFLSNKQGTTPPISIAIDGPWGSGKSSFMRMLRHRLQPDLVTAGKSGLDLSALPTTSLGWQWFRYALSRWRHPGAVKAWWPAGPVVDQEDQPRKFETAYVNVWRCQSAKSLSAAILQQVLHDFAVRHGADFMLELYIARLNKWKILQAASDWLFGNVFALALLTVVTVYLLSEGMTINSEGVFTGFDAAFSGSALGSLGLLVMGLLRKLRKGEKQIKLSEFLDKPNYANLVGSEAEVERDFQRILEVLCRRGLTLALFIDDLDRCSPAETARIVEALNVFFAREGEENCIFILGLHRDLVAANLEIAYEKLVTEINRNPSLAPQRPFGRRFLEKLAQLIVHIPDAQDAMAGYVGHLSGATGVQLKQAVRQKFTRAAESNGTDDGVEIDEEWEKTRTKLLAQDGIDEADIDRAEAAERERLALIDDADALSEQDRDVQAIFTAISPALHASPRQYKRFFNVFRLNNYVAAAVKAPSEKSHRAQLLATARHTALELEFPAVATWARREDVGLHQLTKWAEQLESYIVPKFRKDPNWGPDLSDDQKIAALNNEIDEEPSDPLGDRAVKSLFEHQQLRQLLLLTEEKIFPQAPNAPSPEDNP